MKIITNTNISSEIRACHQHQILFGTTNSLHLYDLGFLIVTKTMMIIITKIEIIMTMVIITAMMMMIMMMIIVMIKVYL